MRALFFIILSAFCWVDIQAQEVRVSIKVILDVAGNRPSEIPDNTKFFEAFEWINERMEEYNRGIEFVPFEIVTIGGPSNPEPSNKYNGSTIFINGPLITSLEGDAEANPTLYQWRSDMINVYYSRTQASNGICSFPFTTASHDEGILIDHRRADEPEVLLHEIGHFFDLRHTAVQECGTTPMDDNDWDRDQIAINNYGVPYANLTTAQQELVDLTFNNVMSQIRNEGEYRTILTECQLDRWHQALADWTTRQDVTSAAALYVDDDDPDTCDTNFPNVTPCSCDGTPDIPFGDAHCAFSKLDGVTKDVIVFKPGEYDAEQIFNNGVILDKPAILTATRQGSAIIKP